jgi:murein DD-endopeptidase MepM/ murein hydrolase activator NlpD
VRVRPLLLAAVLVGLVVAPAQAAEHATAGSAATATSDWGWPLPGEPEVDRPFQPPASTWGAGHRGVDLRGELGERVLAAGQGTVTYSGLLAGRGVVTVSHSGGLRTTYEPVDAQVHVGDVVAVGDVLGTLSTGHASCGLGVTCLHWGLLRGRTYLDPLGVIVSGTLQLLPINAKAPHKLKQRNAKKDLKKAKKWLNRAKRVAKAVKKGAPKAARAVGRVAAKGGRLVARVATRAGPTVARAAARSVASAAAAAAAPEVIVIVTVTVVVGGTVYYVRRRA